MVDRTGDLRRRIEFSPCSQGGVPLPGGVERGADYRWAVDLARVGMDPAVVHRRKGKAGRLEPSLGGVLGEHEMAPAGGQQWSRPRHTEGAIDLVYALPNLHVEYLRVEPRGIPTAFWRSVGPSHNVFVTESFIDELAAAAKQDPVAYRRALLDKSPRAKAVLDLAAEKAGWGQQLPKGTGRGVSVQFAFATYMAQIAEVEVSKEGAVRVRRVVCAVDCGTPVNPDTIRAQLEGGIMFGV